MTNPQPAFAPAFLMDRPRRLLAAGWFAFWIVVFGTLGASPIAAGDWPTYRANVARTASIAETLDAELSLQWLFRPASGPTPAWPPPAEELPRTHVDNANYAVLAGDTVYFADAAAGQVLAVDASAGRIRWRWFAEGPVRFAPTVVGGRVYFGSDDGYVYCLDAGDGSLVWKHRAGPGDEKVIGNGSMISLWPVRSSVLVDGGTAYFAAGVFPYEGQYVGALDARNGAVRWINDTMGDRAHELEFGGISPHGYLAASADVLYVPSGRAMPAAFDRRDGRFLFYASAGGKRGGVWAMVDGDRLIAGIDGSGSPIKAAYDGRTGRPLGDVFPRLRGWDMAVAGDVAYVTTPEGVAAAPRRGGQPLWRHAGRGYCSVIAAGRTVVAGGEGEVVLLDAATGRLRWRAAVEGRAVGLAASRGRLVVSTDAGLVYGFGPGGGSGPRVVGAAQGEGDEAGAAAEAARAARILRETKQDAGYCLVLECGEGRLACELARRSRLKIIGLEQDAQRRAAARRRLEAAGLLGARVVVAPWRLEDLPPYFANLIVADRPLSLEAFAATEAARRRVLRPWGGVELLPVRTGDGRVEQRRFVAGPLPGAGTWTHQYADPQNTACSGDRLVNGPLGVLWFGEPGPRGMVERHGAAEAPLAVEGRLFIEGERLIMAVDAFNGTLLWRREIPGAVRVKVKADSGNLAATPTGLYVAAHSRCYRLDPATGRTMRVYELPGAGERRRWGYISVADGVLYGSAAKPMEQPYAAMLDVFFENGRWRPLEQIPEDAREDYAHFKKQYPDPEAFRLAAERSGLFYRFMTAFPHGGEFLQDNAVTSALMTSDRVFALDPETGRLLWQVEGRRIANITIVVGDGKVFFADAAVTERQRDEALAERRRLIREGIYRERQGVLDELREQERRLEEYRGRREEAAARGGDTRSLDRQIGEVAYLVSSLRAELRAEEHAEGTLSREDADVRLVTALDARTGRLLWRRPVDLTGCCGDAMGAAYRDGLLLFFGNYGNHDAWRFRIGGLRWRRITVLDAETGRMVWSRPLNYRTRPVLVGDQIIVEPRACWLRTGEPVMREHPITGQQVPWEFLRPGHTCGLTAASAAGLFYRSACTAFYDLARDRGVTIFGGYRPGCAISVVPACGVLLSPEASAGCTCSYPIRCSVALVRKPERPQPWTIYVTPGPLRPVEHLAVNFGAVADMKDEQGTVWFAYPNPNTARYTHFPNYGVKLDLKDEVASGGGYFARDFRGRRIAGTDKPWLFTSGCVGLRRCEFPLLDGEPDGPAARYAVRLGFAAPEGDAPGQRVFDVKLQGRTVWAGCDIVQAAGGADRALVRTFRDVPVRDRLVLELVPRDGAPTAASAPVIQFVEIRRQQ